MGTIRNNPCVVIIFCTNISLLNGAVFFPTSSTYGIFAAIAVPLDLGPHRNVFVSYNFEANYNLPVNWQLPAYFDLEDTRHLKNKENVDFENEGSGENSDTIPEELWENDGNNHTSVQGRKRRSLLSRQIFYSILQQKFQMHGYNGESCLLRMICEINASRIAEGNGFLGSILHIIFSPSSSRDEGIHKKYYHAELHGIQSKCSRYKDKCSKNILSLISTSVQDIETLLRKK